MLLVRLEVMVWPSRRTDQRVDDHSARDEGSRTMHDHAAVGSKK